MTKFLAKRFLKLSPSAARGRELAPDAIAVALLAGAIGAFCLLACAGANGDAAPTVPEGGADTGVTIVIVSCGDAGGTE